MAFFILCRRMKIHAVGSFWRRLEGQSERQPPRFVLVHTLVDPTCMHKLFQVLLLKSQREH